MADISILVSSADAELAENHKERVEHAAHSLGHAAKVELFSEGRAQALPRNRKLYIIEFITPDFNLNLLNGEYKDLSDLRSEQPKSFVAIRVPKITSAIESKSGSHWDLVKESFEPGDYIKMIYELQQNSV